MITAYLVCARSLKWNSGLSLSLSNSGQTSHLRTTKHGLRERRYGQCYEPFMHCKSELQSYLATAMSALSENRQRPLLMSSCGSLQHLIIDGSPKWDIYRTVPVSLSGSSSAAASMPQASKAAPAVKREAAPALAKRDPLLEAATAGGVLLDSGKYTFQVKATFCVCQCGIKNARRPCRSGYASSSFEDACFNVQEGL